MEVEQADAAHLWRDGDVRWVAGEPRAGDAVLGDVDRIHHHRRYAGRAIALPEDLAVKQMNGGTAILAGEFGLFRRHGKFGEDFLVMDDTAPVDRVTAQIDGDDDAGAERTANRDWHRIDQRAVN